MTTTAHEWALEKSVAWYWNHGAISQHVPAGCIKTYLQALLGDAETVEACSKAYLNAVIEKDPDLEIMGRVHCAMKEALATLKRMGGV